jgi:hypothetical protein
MLHKVSRAYHDTLIIHISVEARLGTNPPTTTLTQHYVVSLTLMIPTIISPPSFIKSARIVPWPHAWALHLRSL